MPSVGRHLSTDSLHIHRAGPEDLAAIRSLLHATFVHELGQYPDDGSGTHCDKFESKNQSFLARENASLVGMIAVHGKAPFSVAARLPAGVALEQIADHPLEVRLLCVIPGRRSSRIAFRLMATAYSFALRHGYRELWISGVKEQIPLYRKLGFTALGPAVADGQAYFTPMRVRLEQLPPSLVRLAQRNSSLEPNPASPPMPILSLLPGPARMNQATKSAAASAPRYHRSASFLQIYRETQGLLSAWMDHHGVALFPGGGTHANDVVAQSLAHLPLAQSQTGLILCNGEFGRRLRHHALAAQIPFRCLDSGWQQPWDLDAIAKEIQEHPPCWIWAVHCESSTGMLNPVEKVVELAQTQDEGSIPFALDAISTLGAMPLPRGIAFASAVSGKAFQALPGLAIVAANPCWMGRLQQHPWPPASDLAAHWKSLDPPHTLGFPVLAALHASLSTSCLPSLAAKRLLAFEELGKRVRQQLRFLGVRILSAANTASPVMTTFEVPEGLTTQEFLQICASWGFQLAGHSPYLRNRRLAQIATYGDFQWAELAPLFTRWALWKGQNPFSVDIAEKHRENAAFSRFSE